MFVSKTNFAENFEFFLDILIEDKFISLFDQQ